MKKLFLLLTVSAILFVACVKKAPMGDRFITLSYKQTFCADPWTTNLSNDSLTLVHVSDYLKAKNIFFESLTIKQERAPDDCYACSCKSGKVIYVSTFDNDSCKVQFGRIGFK